MPLSWRSRLTISRNMSTASPGPEYFLDSRCTVGHGHRFGQKLGLNSGWPYRNLLLIIPSVRALLWCCNNSLPRYSLSSSKLQYFTGNGSLEGLRFALVLFLLAVGKSNPGSSWAPTSVQHNGVNALRIRKETLVDFWWSWSQIFSRAETNSSDGGVVESGSSCNQLQQMQYQSVQRNFLSLQRKGSPL